MNLLPRHLVRPAPEAADKVLEKIEQVQALRHRLVVVLGESATGKTRCLRQVADRSGNETVQNVGLLLSRQLLELPASERPLQLRERFDELVAEAGDPAILDNLEVLFEPSLSANALALLENASRGRTVVAAWRGSVSDGRLRYAAPGHPEHRRYLAESLVTVDLNPSESEARQ